MSITTRTLRAVPDPDAPVPISQKIAEKAARESNPPKPKPALYDLATFESTLTRFHLAQAMGKAEQQLRHIAEQCEALAGGKESALLIRAAIDNTNDAEDELPKEAA